MSAALILVLVVAVAYLAAHVAFDWIARRFLIVSGAEYLVLGILIGPQVSGLLSAQDTAGMAPLTTLALGWIGAIVGTQFYLPELVRIRGLLYRLAFGQSLITATLVAGAEIVLFERLFDMPLGTAAIPAIALGAIAAASAPAGIEVAARRLGQRGPVVRQLQVATAIDALVAITVFGLLLAVERPVLTGHGSPTATEWAVISIAIGIVGGVLFHLFVGAERHIDRLFISLGGAIILVSGAAAYLGLSPLLTSMVMGMVLVNTSSNRDEIVRTLSAGERPFYFVLLIIAGASWQPSLRAWIAPVFVFIIMRGLGKIGGARLSARLAGALPVTGLHWGRALLGQGGLALALALDYTQRGALPIPNIVFTAAIASVLLTDLSSAHLIRSVMSRLMGEPAEADEAAVERDDQPVAPPAAELR